AVLIFNEGQPGRTDVLQGTLGEPSITIPVVGTSFAVGEELAVAGTSVQVTTDTQSEVRSTYNVIAETPGGRPDNVVMVGAHLDSVAEGPGINDNGSGSAAQLEVALKLATVVKKPKNKVRFAWWSAEEFGLLGSEHYVGTRTQSQLGDIALYLNFDMVASPSFARFIYDGDDSDGVGAGPGPQGSAAIEKQFEAFYAGRSLPFEGTDFSGRSDYGPFIAVGIPSGGLFTGAEEIKTAEQVAKYGGTEGLAFDACYHQACDTSRNVNTTALDQNADAIANAVATFAATTEAVNGRPSAARTSSAALAAKKKLAGRPSGAHHGDVRR
ncbi:MAG: M28 family metallopeptidase, partial [Angustibacter sp.]